MADRPAGSQRTEPDDHAEPGGAERAAAARPAPAEEDPAHPTGDEQARRNREVDPPA